MRVMQQNSLRTKQTIWMLLPSRRHLCHSFLAHRGITVSRETSFIIFIFSVLKSSRAINQARWHRHPTIVDIIAQSLQNCSASIACLQWLSSYAPCTITHSSFRAIPFSLRRCHSSEDCIIEVFYTFHFAATVSHVLIAQHSFHKPQQLPKCYASFDHILM